MIRRSNDRAGELEADPETWRTGGTYTRARTYGDGYECVDCGEVFEHRRDAHGHPPHPHDAEEPEPGQPSQNSTDPAEDDEMDAEEDAESEEDIPAVEPDPEPEADETGDSSPWWRFW